MSLFVEITRKNDGKPGMPSYAIIDSQSIKTTSCGEKRGIDGAKKIKGRKRHIVVDSMENLLWVMVHAANIHDTKSGIFPALGAKTLYPSIQRLCGDAGYRGTFVDEVADTLDFEVDIVIRNDSKSWKILPKRWIVERTFSWMNNSRRLSKDYEKTTASVESMVVISHIHTLIKRL